MCFIVSFCIVDIILHDSCIVYFIIVFFIRVYLLFFNINIV